MVACSLPAPPRASQKTGCASRRSAAASAAKAAHHWSGVRACAVHGLARKTHLCARWRTNLRAGGLDRGLDRAGSVGADTCADRLVVDRRLGCRRHRHLRARARAARAKSAAVPGSKSTCTEAPTVQGRAAAAASASMGSSATHARSAVALAPPWRRRPPPPRSSWRRSGRMRTDGGRCPYMDGREGGTAEGEWLASQAGRAPAAQHAEVLPLRRGRKRKKGG